MRSKNWTKLNLTEKLKFKENWRLAFWHKKSGDLNMVTFIRLSNEIVSLEVLGRRSETYYDTNFQYKCWNFKPFKLNLCMTFYTGYPWLYIFVLEEIWVLHFLISSQNQLIFFYTSYQSLNQDFAPSWSIEFTNLNFIHSYFSICCIVHSRYTFTNCLPLLYSMLAKMILEVQSGFGNCNGKRASWSRFGC